MYLSQRIVQCFTLVLIISLCAITQVSSLKCFECNSDVDSDCIMASNQTKFIRSCTYPKSASSNPSSSGHQDNEPKSGVEYDCASARGISTKDGRTIVVRGCAVKPVTCDTYKIVYAVGNGDGNGLQFTSCERCSSDLCNSSGHLNVGISALLLSLLAVYFVKF